MNVKNGEQCEKWLVIESLEIETYIEHYFEKKIELKIITKTKNYAEEKFSIMWKIS